MGGLKKPDVLRMNWRNLTCSVPALLLLFGTTAYPYLSFQNTEQSTPPAAFAPKPPKPQFFAGQVVEADAEHVKVSRDLVGRQPETRVFMLNAKTKTPKGGIKLKSRVTVRYQHLPEQDLALEIQVRSFNRTPKPT
jgi:hypothetical protein